MLPNPDISDPVAGILLRMDSASACGSNSRNTIARENTVKLRWFGHPADRGLIDSRVGY